MTVIAPEIERELETSNKDLASKAESYRTIGSGEAQAQANAYLVDVKKRLKVVNNEEEKVKRPQLEALNATRDLFKRLRKPLETAETEVKQAIVGYHRQQREEANRQAEKIVGRVGEGRGKLKESTAVRKISEIDRPEAHMEVETGGSVGIRMVEVVEVVDISLIPRRYLEPTVGPLSSMTEALESFKPWPRIRKQAIELHKLQKSGHKVDQIPGIKVYETESVAGSTR